MPISKKKQKKFNQAQSKIGAKASQKAKARELIRNRDKLKKSKKDAKALDGGESENEEDDSAAQLKAVEEVDSLFTKGSFFEDAKDDGGESSDDAFVDVGGDAAEDDDEEMEVEEPTEATKHAEELAALKETDPTFYQYLMENEKHLLDFTADDPEEEGMDVEEDNKQPEVPSTILTLDRFRALSSNAENGSFHAFRVLVVAFKGAVRQAEDKGEDGDLEVMQRPKGKVQRVLQVEDDEVYSELLLWMFANVGGLMERHAGDKPEKSGLDVKSYSKWKRVKHLYRNVWGELLFITRSFTGADTLEPLLRSCGTVDCLKFLWPFEKLRQMLIKRAMYLWANASSQSVRLMAFMLLRNTAGIAQRLAKNTEESSKALEQLVRAMYKEFAEIAGRVKTAINWGTISRFRFLENCIAELLRIDAHMAYRVGYSSIRQLALMLRNAVMYTSKAGQKKKAQDPMHLVYGWSFLRALSLWSHAVASVKSLEPLVYPVVMLATTTLKTKITATDYLPYCFHVLMLLNDIAAGTQQFVPVSSYILKILQHVIPIAEKQKHNNRTKQNETVSKILDVDLLIKMPKTVDYQALSSCCYKAIYLLTDHLGLISRSPAFPEISAPVIAHLRRLVKSCGVDIAREDMKSLIQVSEQTVGIVTSKRENLSDNVGFLVFGHELPLAAKREHQKKQKASEEAQKTKSLLPSSVPEVLEEDDKPSLTKKQKKAARKRANKINRLEMAKSGMPQEADEVEEMAFSDDE